MINNVILKYKMSYGTDITYYEKIMEDLRFVSNNITYYVIATYYDEEYTQKNYIIYTDKNLKDNKLQLYYAIYEKVNNGEIKLLDITTPLEKKIALSFLKEVMKTSK